MPHSVAFPLHQFAPAAEAELGAWRMTPRHIPAELLMPKAQGFCSLLLTPNLCHSSEPHEDAAAHQGLEICLSSPQNQRKPQSWAFQLHEAVGCPKNLFRKASRVQAAALPRPAGG